MFTRLSYLYLQSINIYIVVKLDIIAAAASKKLQKPLSNIIYI